jgi:hypothetical protein
MVEAFQVVPASLIGWEQRSAGIEPFRDASAEWVRGSGPHPTVAVLAEASPRFLLWLRGTRIAECSTSAEFEESKHAANWTPDERLKLLVALPSRLRFKETCGIVKIVCKLCRDDPWLGTTTIAYEDEKPVVAPPPVNWVAWLLSRLALVAAAVRLVLWVYNRFFVTWILVKPPDAQGLLRVARKGEGQRYTTTIRPAASTRAFRVMLPRRRLQQVLYPRATMSIATEDGVYVRWCLASDEESEATTLHLPTAERAVDAVWQTTAERPTCVAVVFNCDGRESVLSIDYPQASSS